MYLLVIVTLIIGLLSIYAQVLSVQAARFAAGQAGLAWTMMTWHDAALSMATKVKATPGVTYPCSLTYTTSLLTRCVTPTSSPSSSGTVTDGSNTFNYIDATNLVHLPISYNASLYQFASVLYQDVTSSSPFVITFVQPPVLSNSNPAPGFITLLPNNRLSTLSMADLIHQLKASGIPSYAYGGNTNTGTASVVTTNFAQANGTYLQYNVPLTVGLQNGAIAIVSAP